MKIRIPSLYLLMGGFLLFLILYTPRANLEIKLFFLIPIIFFITLGLIIKKINLPHFNILIWAFTYITYGFTWSYLGLLNGNPGYESYFRLFVLWGVLYLLLVTGIKDKKTLLFLLKVCIFSLIPISLFNIMLFLNHISIISNNFLLEIEMGARSGLHEGYFQITSHNIGSLLFLIPFLISIIIIDSGKFFKIKKQLLTLILLLSLITAFLSGRRALWLVIALTPFILSGLLLSIKKTQLAVSLLKKIAFLSILLFGLLLLAITVLPDLELWNMDGFAGRISDSIAKDNPRDIQATALMSDFYNSPVFGHGFGIGVSGVIRSQESPWLYELSYLLILHNTGIVGFFIYLSLIFYLLYKTYILIKYDAYAFYLGIPLFTGLLSFLIANATNPYMFSCDFMFPIFLSLSFINVFIKNQTNSL